MSDRRTDKESGHVVHATIPVRDLVAGERLIGSAPNEAGTVEPTLPPWMRQEKRRE